MKFVFYLSIPSSLHFIFWPSEKLLRWRHFVLFVGQSCVSFHLLAWSRSKSSSWKRRAEWKRTSSGFFPRSAWLRHAHWKSSSSDVSLVAWSPFLDLRLREVGIKCFRANHHRSITCVPPVLLKPGVLMVHLSILNSKTSAFSLPGTLLSPPTPPNPTQTSYMCERAREKKNEKKTQKMRFVQSKCPEITKNAFSLWHQQRENAKTVFRHAAFYPCPANYNYYCNYSLTNYELVIDYSIDHLRTDKLMPSSQLIDSSQVLTAHSVLTN